ncbi:MAG: polyprenyl synthetase family protein [Candidatus Heimdallarchaeota archaeon]|nr:polyprenyl synthetase family protein [Candidatus Heimdallarchaeota archaeon]MCK4878105.1 polyprenyl synthetase family protein [Candidatus Heimdallarchaeota archaeon]
MHYAKLQRKVDDALHDFMNEQINSVQDNPFLKYYYKQIYDFLFSGGKRIRPVLMALCYQSIKSDVVGKEILSASLSLELLHNASLIHDDIMDNAETRRGKKAFHRVLQDYAENNSSSKTQNDNNYGISMGILGGDFAYNLAYKAINTKEFPSDVTLRAAIEFNEGFLRIVQGVVVETDLMRRTDVTENQYFSMIAGKTAALFEKAARIGAIFAGGTESQISGLGKYALDAGLAFQIVDDIIGTFGDSRKTGKPIDSDIKEGKKTLLLIKTIENANDDQLKVISKVVGNRQATDQEINDVRTIFKETGSLDFANKKTEKLFNNCISYLEVLEPMIEEKFKKYLIEIAKMGINRDK